MFGRKKRIRRNAYKGRHTNRLSAALSRILKSTKIVLVLAAFGLFNLMLIFGHDWITQTDRLGIQAISVTGCERLTPEIVIVQAGLTEARNILTVNLTTTRKRLLAHPWIADVQVTRDIPDRLHIHIFEHRCIAVLDLGRRFLMSAEGHVFKELTPGETPDVPVVSGLRYTDLGLHTEAPSMIMRSVMKILKPRSRSSRLDLVAQIREIQADPALGLTIFITDARQSQGYHTVMLGFDDFDEKYAALQRIDAYLEKSPRYAGYRSIDLNNLNRIVVNPVTTNAAENARKEV